MHPVELVARWYIRAARILLRRAIWRATKRRVRRKERGRFGPPSFTVSVPGPMTVVVPGRTVVVAETTRTLFDNIVTRKIKPFIDLEHQCPRCDVRSHYVPKQLNGDQWECRCIDCGFKWSDPVVYRDAESLAESSRVR